MVTVSVSDMQYSKVTPAESSRSISTLDEL